VHFCRFHKKILVFIMHFWKIINFCHDWSVLSDAPLLWRLFTLGFHFGKPFHFSVAWRRWFPPIGAKFARYFVQRSNVHTMCLFLWLKRKSTHDILFIINYWRLVTFVFPKNYLSSSAIHFPLVNSCFVMRHTSSYASYSDTPYYMCRAYSFPFFKYLENHSWECSKI
jgi:hypothetical protein